MWVLIGLLVAAGPLLRGAWDLWAQTLLLIGVIGGASFWLCWRVASGQVPAFSGRVLLWTAGLALLGGAAAFFGPVWAYAAPEWRWRLAGLWVFAALSVVSDADRERIDASIHAAAWVLVILVLWQGFVEGQARPPGSMPKENIFAGTCLFLLPLAAKRRDGLLLGVLLMVMLWSRSVGAWLALACAWLVIGVHRAPTRRLGLVLAVVCAAAVLGKFRDVAVLDRVRWWGAAWGMFLQRPWTGYGPGAFAYVMPAFSPPGEVSSLYAHQSALESLAETGLFHTLLFFGGAAALLARGRTHRTFGALAVLIQSMWDVTLSIPANAWLFSYFAGSSIRPSTRLVEVPPRWRMPLVLLILGSGTVLSGRVWSGWQADRLRAMAAAELAGPGELSAVDDARRLLERSAALEDHPEARRLLAEVELKTAGPGAAAGLAAAAGHLERSVELNPFRPSTWQALEAVYRGLGKDESALDARRRGGVFCPSLRPR